MRDDYSSIREWLNQVDFHWDLGKIIVQFTEEEYSDETDSPGWRSPKSASIVQMDHPILTKSFDTGFGSPQCPRFIAEDDEKFIFPSQYDGATSCNILHKDIKKYLDIKTLTPYPGG